MKWMRSIYDVVLDRSTEEILGAIAISVALSIAVSGLFALLRRKVEDRVLLVIVLLLVVSVTSMGLGAGYIGLARDRRLHPGGGNNPEGYPGIPYGRRPAGIHRMMRRADTNGDNRISREEAAEFARSFIGNLDPSQADSVEFMALSEAISQSVEPSPMDRIPPPVELESRFGNALLLAADADHNSQLSKDELANFFATGDTNNDGLLNPPEIRQVMRTLTRNLEPFPGGPGGFEPGPPMGRGVPPTTLIAPAPMGPAAPPASGTMINR